MDRNMANPLVDDNKLKSKQSVILEGVRDLDTRVNNFRRTLFTMVIFMFITILANFGTTMAGLIYIKDAYIEGNTMVNTHHEPVGTASSVELHSGAEFPSYQQVALQVASGMAVDNGTHITRVQSASIASDTTVDLYDTEGSVIATATISEPITVNTRTLKASMGHNLVMVNAATSASRLCTNPNKPCYDIWKRECIPCSGEYRGIKQGKSPSN